MQLRSKVFVTYIHVCTYEAPKTCKFWMGKRRKCHLTMNFTSFPSFPFTGNSHCFSVAFTHYWKLQPSLFIRDVVSVVLFHLLFFALFRFYFHVSLSMLQICICNDKRPFARNSIDRKIDIKIFFFSQAKKKKSLNLQFKP